MSGPVYHSGTGSWPLDRVNQTPEQLPVWPYEVNFDLIDTVIRETLPRTGDSNTLKLRFETDIPFLIQILNRSTIELVDKRKAKYDPANSSRFLHRNRQDARSSRPCDSRRSGCDG